MLLSILGYANREWNPLHTTVVAKSLETLEQYNFWQPIHSKKDYWLYFQTKVFIEVHKGILE